MSSKKKVLIITYYWPPSGGSGVQRWLKFSKYLRDFNIEPVIYTVDNPSYPIKDTSLESEIPLGLEVLKQPIFEPNSFLSIFGNNKKKESAGFLNPNPTLLGRFFQYVRANYFIPDARKFWIKPSVKNTLDELNIFAQSVTLEGKEPLAYQMDLRVNNQFACTAKGTAVHKILDVSSSMNCRDLDITHFLPYIDDIARKELQVYDVKLRSLMVGFDANLTAKDNSTAVVINVDDANLHLDNFALNKRSTNKRLATFSKFDVSGIKLNIQLIKDFGEQVLEEKKP
mgnify:CR=1 FL=1